MRPGRDVTIDPRSYRGWFPSPQRVGAQILRDLGLRQRRLRTNNPKKVSFLEVYGIQVAEQLPIEVQPNHHNARYLRTIKAKPGS